MNSTSEEQTNKQTSEWLSIDDPIPACSEPKCALLCSAKRTDEVDFNCDTDRRRDEVGYALRARIEKNTE